MKELIDEMIKKFEESEGGSTFFIFDDGDEYHTDTGYAMEGINAFAKRLNKRLISMTNGDMIKTMFPDLEITEIRGSFDKEKLLGYRTWLGGRSQDFLIDWWNAPYKTESGNEK